MRNKQNIILTIPSATGNDSFIVAERGGINTPMLYRIVWLFTGAIKRKNLGTYYIKHIYEGIFKFENDKNLNTY